MELTRALALAVICARALADTRTTPHNGSRNNNEDVYKINSDPAHTYTIPESAKNNIVYKYNSDLIVKDDIKILDSKNMNGVFDEDGGIIYSLTDEEYYKMPRLFHLDEYKDCQAVRGVYCLGSFELTPTGYSSLFNTMQRYSADWVNNFNHTRLHRGICLSKSCSPPPPPGSSPSDEPSTPVWESWFESCVNASTMSSYNFSAKLYKLDYCTRGPEQSRPLDVNERGFASLMAVLIGLAAISTALDLTLADYTKKGYGWALSWSLRSSWRTLVAPAPASFEVDLRAFDGLRVFCMMCIIVEHVCWLSTLSYVGDTRQYEELRRSGEVILLTNSTLVVQIFFLMASFLLAHKLLKQRQHLPPINTFVHTMLNRFIRISPSYFVVVWFASSWWERLGAGPQWSPLIRSEAEVCRRKWWTHLLYLNNVVYPDEKCLIQTWYLAADMQLYALALALTLALRGRRAAVPILGALFVGMTVGCYALAYAWHLVPTLVLHRPESVRLSYSGDSSFNVLYQSPFGNATGALAGLLLAHLHHALGQTSIRLTEHKFFRWVSILSAPAALWWAALSPMMLGEGPPTRATAATLAALERPIFTVFVIISLLGAINGIKSPWRTWLSHSGTVLARLSFGALLLHMPLNKSLIASRSALLQLDRQNVIVEWFGVAVISYMAALPLALLVELPAQRLHKELMFLLNKPTADQNNNKTRAVLDKTDLCPTKQCSGNG